MNMVLENAELTLGAQDVEAGTNKGTVLEIQAKATKYGQKYLARMKMNDGRKWAVWLGDSCVRTLGRFVRENNKAEEGLIVSFGVRSYEKKDGTEGKSPTVEAVQ